MDRTLVVDGHAILYAQELSKYVHIIAFRVYTDTMVCTDIYSIYTCKLQTLVEYRMYSSINQLYSSISTAHNGMLLYEALFVSHSLLQW